jgi:hypothetical protein
MGNRSAKVVSSLAQSCGEAPVMTKRENSSPISSPHEEVSCTVTRGSLTVEKEGAQYCFGAKRYVEGLA